MHTTKPKHAEPLISSTLPQTPPLISNTSETPDARRRCPSVHCWLASPHWEMAGSAAQPSAGTGLNPAVAPLFPCGPAVGGATAAAKTRGARGHSLPDREMFGGGKSGWLGCRVARRPRGDAQGGVLFLAGNARWRLGLSAARGGGGVGVVHRCLRQL